MHDTAMGLGQLFFELYWQDIVGRPRVIVEVGSQDVNGSLRAFAPAGSVYLGIDLEKGEGVDLVATEPSELPLVDESVDTVVSTSCFEHDAMFWLTFLEMVRVLAPGGLIYLNVPSNGKYHAMPEDCWRFYPDSGLALERWAKRMGRDVVLLESFLSERRTGEWNDCVLVFGRPPATLPSLCLHERWRGVTNIRRRDRVGLGEASPLTEDQRLLVRAGWVFSSEGVSFQGRDPFGDATRVDSARS